MATLDHGRCVRVAIRKNGKRAVEPRRNTDARNWPGAPGPKIVGQDSNLVIESLEQLTMSESCRRLLRSRSQQKKSGCKTRSVSSIPASFWRQADQAEGAASSVWVGTTQSLTSVSTSWARWTLMV